MITKTVKGIFIAGVFSSAVFAAPASAVAAEKPDTVKQWIEGASEAVDGVMRYPGHSLRRGETGYGVYEVTIDQSGDVVTFETIDRINHARLNSAAKRVIKEADFPAIPRSYDSDQMTFQVVLSYLTPQEQSEMKRKWKRGTTSVESYAGKIGSDSAQFVVLPSTSTN